MSFFNSSLEDRRRLKMDIRGDRGNAFFAQGRTEVEDGYRRSRGQWAF